MPPFSTLEVTVPYDQRVLNAFGIPYVVLHDVDVVAGMPPDQKAALEKTNRSIAALAGTNRVVVFPVKMEVSLSLAEHLKDQYKAHEFFANPANMSQEFKDVVRQVFE